MEICGSENAEDKGCAKEQFLRVQLIQQAILKIIFHSVSDFVEVSEKLLVVINPSVKLPEETSVIRKQCLSVINIQFLFPYCVLQE